MKAFFNLSQCGQINGRNVHFIDFSDCGLGYYLYDCVPTLSYLRHRPDFQAQWRAFFNGYQKVRALPVDYKAQFETFTALRTVFLVNWVCNWPNPVYQTWGESFLRESVIRIKHYLQHGWVPLQLSRHSQWISVVISIISQHVQT